MNYLKRNKAPIIIAFTQWAITTILQVDRVFFENYEESVYFYLSKAFYFLFLIVAWLFLFHAVRKVKSNDVLWKRGLFIFLVYFFIVMCFLVILWPGTWSWDDLYTLSVIMGYKQWHAWQHTLTGAYQDVLLQILPFPGGLIFLQNVIISLCVSFSVVRLEKYLT